MLRDLEVRLATVLGADLAAPFGGRVRVLPDTPGGQGPVLQVAVTAARRLEADLGAFRQERPPGLPNERRVARLAADLAILIAPANNQDRSQVIQAADALVYLLDAQRYRSGEALVEAGDQGFLLQSLVLAGAEIESDSDAGRVLLTAEGWFWPVGVPGEAGVAIDELHLRQIALPLSLDLPPLVAGGGAAALSLTLPRSGTQRLRADGSAQLPFGQVALVLLSPDGSAGAGALSGGQSGGPASQVLDAGAALDFAYTPPAAPGRDVLVVRAVTAAGELGLEISRFELVTEPAP